MSNEYVKNVNLPNGCSYTGYADVEFGEVTPKGMGKMEFPDGHSASGNFLNIPNGVTYINYHSHMRVGHAVQGDITGWGIQMGNGRKQFGIFLKGKLIQDFTPLVSWMFDHIGEDDYYFQKATKNKSWIRIFTSPKRIFMGIDYTNFTRCAGFHFLDNAETYVGINLFQNSLLFGYYIKFSPTGDITFGQFNNNEWISETQDKFSGIIDLFTRADKSSFLNYKIPELSPLSKQALQYLNISKDIW